MKLTFMADGDGKAVGGNDLGNVSWMLDTCFSANMLVCEFGFHCKYDLQYIDRCCLPPGDYTLTCRDSGGDGWNGAIMEIQRHRYCDDFVGYKAMRRITISGIDTQFWALNDSCDLLLYIFIIVV